MREEGGLKVRGGRHPLQELSVTQFIANDTNIGEDAARLHLLTGPNSSGKSVYLKQVCKHNKYLLHNESKVGLIVYLAHLGSWVPALEAQVPLTDRLLTRIQTVESISLGMSAFQVRFDASFSELTVFLLSATWHRSALLCVTQQAAPYFWWTNLARELRPRTERLCWPPWLNICLSVGGGVAR